MKKILSLIALALVALMPVSVYAGTALTSNTATVALSQSVPAFITITAPAALTLNGTTPVPATISVSWNLPGPANSALYVVGYFSSTNALTSGSDNITSSQVSVNVNGGGANPVNGAVVQGIGVAGATRQLINQTGILQGPGSRAADTVNFSLTGIGSQNAGHYVGVFNIAATAF